MRLQKIAAPVAFRESWLQNSDVAITRIWLKRYRHNDNFIPGWCVCNIEQNYQEFLKLNNKYQRLYFILLLVRVEVSCKLLHCLYCFFRTPLQLSEEFVLNTDLILIYIQIVHIRAHLKCITKSKYSCGYRQLQAALFNLLVLVVKTNGVQVKLN